MRRQYCRAAPSRTLAHGDNTNPGQIGDSSEHVISLVLSLLAWHPKVLKGHSSKSSSGLDRIPEMEREEVRDLVLMESDPT